MTVNDSIPAPLSLVSATPSQGNPCTGDPAVACDLGTIPTSQMATVVIVVDIPASPTGTIANTATVSSPDDAMSGNNSDTDMTVVNVMADLRIEKADSPDLVIAGGGNLTYTVTVTNDGPADATNDKSLDTLPAGVTFVSTSGCAEDPNGVPTCTLGDIAAGASKLYTITISVDPNASGTLTNHRYRQRPRRHHDPGATGTISNTATVTPPAGSTDASNLDDSATDNDTLITKKGDLSITKSDSPDPVTDAAMLTYTITVAHSGPSDAVGVGVTDTFPTEFETPSWTCVANGAGGYAHDQFLAREPHESAGGDG